jgi:hypothetical protein
LWLFAVVACGDSGGGGEGSGAATAASGSGGSTSASGVGGAQNGPGPTTTNGPGTGSGGGPGCKAPSPPHKGETEDVASAKAELVDQDGKPAADVTCSVCGTNICSKLVASDAQGKVLVDSSGVDFDDARFNAGYNGKGFAKVSAFVPTKPNMDYGKVRVLRLPPLSAGAPVEAGKDASSGGVTLGVAAGAKVEFDFAFRGPDQRFVAAIFDITTVPPKELPYVDPSLGLEVLIGLGALHTFVCPAASLSFDNVRGWAANAEVEIFMHGTTTYEHYVPYGEWGKIAEAAVSADGKTVATKDGEGIELFDVYGARLKK